MVFSQKSLDFEKNIFRRARRRHYWLRWSQRWRPQQRAQVEIFLFLISSKKRFLFQVKKVISQNVSYFQWNVECKRWRCGHHHLAPSQHCRPPPLGNNQLFWNPKSTMAPPPKLTSPWLNPGGVLNSWNSVWQQAGPAPKFKLLENSIRRSSTSPVPKGVCHILANLGSGQSHFSQKEPESYYSWISAAKDSDTNCNFTPNWPLSRFLSLIQNVENPNSPRSCLQTNPHSTKKNGKRQKVFQGKRTSFSGVEHEKFSSSFSPPLLPPTAPHHRYQSHWHGMGGGGGANPPKPPSLPKKNIRTST